MVVFTCNKTGVKCARRFLLYACFIGWTLQAYAQPEPLFVFKSPQGFSNCYLQEDSQLPNIRTQKMSILIKAKPVIDIVSFSWYLYNESKRTVDFEGKGHRLHFSVGRKIMNMLFYYATSIITQTILSFYFLLVFHMHFFLKQKKMKVSQSCPTLCEPMDYTVYGIL